MSGFRELTGASPAAIGLCCLLLAACGGGGGGGSGGGGGGSGTVPLTGTMRYEFVPPNPGCFGLNYALTESRPIRAATVQVIDAATGSVLGSTTTGADGRYSVAVPQSRNLRVRVRAELKRNGTPSWDVEVRDNTSNTGQPLAQRPVYVLDSTAFNSGTTGPVRNLTATTGWTGLTYGGVRAAAPFAVLDAIYSAMELVLSVDPQAAFAPLDAFWSINNVAAEGAGSFEDNVAAGEIGTSFYSGGINSLFLLGKADSDTEEFDDHVIVHEWGHYFEDEFSRSDSIGGAHGFGDRLDMRVAFGEGWATALSGIALANPQYCDTQGTGQAEGFDIDIENDAPAPRGWFNEFTAMALVYDLWDDVSDGGQGDTGSIGFAPIYDTMTGLQAVTPAHTSLFTFLDNLVATSPSSLAQVTDLKAWHQVDGSGIYGDGETNAGGSLQPADALPVYTTVSPDGTPVNLCSNREHDTAEANGNRLSEHRFLRMTIATASRYEFDVATDLATLALLPPDDPNDDRDQSDPDLWFYLNGQALNAVVGGQLQGLSGDANRETFTTPGPLAPGDYVMDLVEFRHLDPDTNRQAFPARACFDLTVRPVP